MEIIPKQQAKTVPIKGEAILRLSIGVLVIIIGITLLFYFLQEARKDKLEHLRNEFVLAATPEEERLQTQLIDHQNRAREYVQLVQAKNDATRVLQALERNTHRGVQFTSASVNVDGGGMSLSGRAANILVLQEQLLLLRASEEVESARFSGISMDVDEGGVQFTVTVTFRF